METIKLISKEGQKLEISVKAIQRSVLFRNLLEIGVDCKEIPVEKLTTVQLEKIIKFCTLSQDERIDCICKPNILIGKCQCGSDEAKTAYYREHREPISRWERVNFFCLPIEQVWEYGLVADFLSIYKLSALLRTRIYIDMKGILYAGTMEDLKEFFRKGNFSKEEIDNRIENFRETVVEQEWENFENRKPRKKAPTFKHLPTIIE